MNEIAIISSGDPEKDALELQIHKQIQERLDNNLCPNCRESLVYSDAYNADCPICKFHLQTNVPYGEKPSETIM